MDTEHTFTKRNVATKYVYNQVKSKKNEVLIKKERKENSFSALIAYEQ